MPDATQDHRRAAVPAQRTAGRFALVQRIAERLVATGDEQALADAVATAFVDGLGADAVLVRAVTRDGRALRPLQSRGFPDENERHLSRRVPLDESIPSTVAVREGRPLYWSSLEARDRDFPEFAALRTQLQSWAILPLAVQGETVGVLSVGWAEARPFDPALVALLEVVAHQCALSFDRVRLAAQVHIEREALELLSEGTRLMVSALDPSLIVARLIALAVPRLAPWCAVYLAEEDRFHRVAVEVADDDGLAQQLLRATSVPIDRDTALSAVYRTGEPVETPVASEAVVRSIYDEPLASRILARGLGWSSIVVPIKASGRVLGVMSLVSREWQSGIPSEVRFAAEGLAARAGVAMANARRFEDERRVATQLTEALLPAAVPPIEGIDIAARYLPAGARVAGDWFDVVALSEHRYLIGVGDAGGHGIRAASLMAQLRNAARGLAIDGAAPGALLRALGLLTVHDGPDSFATAAYGLLDPKRGRLRWASAGHIPPLVFGPSGTRWQPSSGDPPLGWMGDARPAEHVVELSPGEGLVLVTDGVVERRNAHLDDGLERLASLVTAHRDGPAAALTARIAELCADADDDCCVVVVRRPPGDLAEHPWDPPGVRATMVPMSPAPAPRRDAAGGTRASGRKPGRRAGGAARLRLAPDPAAAREARTWLVGAVEGWPETIVETARLLVSELVTNAVLHAGTPIEVRVRQLGDRLRVEIADELVTGPLPARHPADAATGRGLRLLGSLADEWGVTRRADGKSVWFVLDRAGEVPMAGRSGAGLAPVVPLLALITSAPPPGGGAGVVTVRMLGVPVSVYLDLEEHNDALIRELTLIHQSSAESSEAAGGVPRRLVELADEVRLVFGPATESLRLQVEAAVRRGRRTVDLEMPVPCGRADVLLHLTDLMDDADAYCQVGDLVTLAPSPTLRRFRRWMAQEVVDQVAGVAPQPWPGGEGR